MPHDKNGALLKEGDIVNVPCIVKAVYGTEEMCNVSMETVESMFPSANKNFFTLNTKQVVKVENDISKS